MTRASLQQRLMMVVLISAIPVFILHVSVQILSDIRAARAGATINTQDIAAAAIPLLQSALIVGDLATAQETLDNIMRHGQFRRLRLLDPGGANTLAEGKPGLSAATGQAPYWLVEWLDFRFTAQAFPIQAGGMTYGTLQAEPSPIFLVADIWQRLWTAVVVWTITVAFLLSVMKVALQRGLRPFEDLAEAAHRFGEGDLDCRAPVSDVPELAETATAFNRMANNLAEARDRLEERVRQRTAELTASEARTSAILRNLLDGVVQFDMQGRILLANEAVGSLFGYREAEMLGRNISLLIPELNRFPLDVCPQQSTGRRCEVTGRRKDGSVFSVDLTANALADDNGSTCIGVLRDISQQKATEAAREAARIDAERLARAKGEFLANMSHEIRTPLNAMLGLAQVGSRKSRGRQIARTFDKILHSGELLLRQINDILDFSKIEAHKLKIEAVPFDLGEVIDRAVDMNASFCFGKGLDFIVDEAADLPTRCLGDPIRLSQVLVNLLSNAIKFTESGRVSLEVKRAGPALLFRVDDTGIGMAEDLQERLFVPFQQADSSITRRFGGTGLGLVICRRLLEMMGGAIRIESHAGQGTCIEVEIALTELEGPARVATCPPFRLLGLSNQEGQGLTRALADHGVRASHVTPGVLASAYGDGLVVADAELVAMQLHYARELLRRGQSLTIVYTPGVENAVPDDVAARSRHLDRPLRWRNMVHACAGEGRDQASWPATVGAPRLSGIRILAADDDASNRLVLEEILGLEGARMVIEANGEFACERLAAEGAAAFDVAITDLQMPRLDGYATARRMREIAPGLPVIGISAHAMPEEMARCLAAGMVDLVTKPVSIEVLVATVLRHLQRGGGSDEAAAATTGPDRPGPPAGDTGSALVDWPALETRFNGKRAFVDELAATVLESFAEIPAQLRAAATAGDCPEMAALSHRTRGMGANLSARRLHELAAQAEESARDRRPESERLARQLAEMLDDVLLAIAARIS